MAARGDTVKYTIVFDRKTGALKSTQGDVEKLNRALAKSGATAQASGTKMASMGKIMTGLGIGAFLFTAARSAAQASDAIDELGSAWEETIGLIVQEAEPALKLISKGLQGLMVVLVGVVKSIRQSIEGEWAEAWETMQLTILQAGERAAGRATVTQKELTKILVQEAQIQLRDITLSGEQKMAIVEKTERKVLEMLRKSAEFQTMDKNKQALAELEIMQKLSTEREAAQREIEAVEFAHLQKRLAQMDEANQLEVAAALETDEQRIARIEERLRREGELLQEFRERGILGEQRFGQVQAQLAAKAGQDILNIRLNTVKKQRALEISRAKEFLAIENAMGRAMIDAAYKFGETGVFNAREFAKQMVQIAGKEAANLIMARAMAGAFIEIQTKGLAGLPAAAAIVAKGAAAASLVAGLTGAAVRGIGGGVGAAGAGAPAEEFPEREERMRQEEARRIGRGEPAVTPAPVAAGEAGDVYQIDIHTFGGDIDEFAARNLARKVAEMTTR